MKRHQINVCILRTGGTNCDVETKRVFDDFEVNASVMRNTSISRKDLDNYHILVFPGGFSYGDYVRAGAVWGKEIKVQFGKALERFVDDGKPVLGICNGFQVLVETGLLPAFNGVSEYPELALATNVSARYECRWVSHDDFLYLKNENKGKCVFTRNIPRGKLLRIPIGHTEGRILLPEERCDEFLAKLINNDQLVFRFARADGSYPNGAYPDNPNGSIHDITGICNPQGNVLGLMPHPERAFYAWQLPDYTRMMQRSEYGDGRLIFESVISYLEEEF
ncbi:MAG: phosphoribosylformylglycinamidine synthase I [Candidatus Bathyarchaeia archaeon]